MMNLKLQIFKFIIVLDRSRSMAGQPLEETKKAAIMMVNKMRSSDFSVVAYDSVYDLIVQLQTVEIK